MKLKRCHVVNFGSYKELQFDFSSPGLSLVYGATGSGKSTICDIACWMLYGITAKNGNADEVRRWQDLDKATSGILSVELSTNLYITVYRSRGNKQNDLWWTENGQEEKKHRGKDLTETQKLLEDQLGVNSFLWLNGAYFSDSSSVSNFFNSSAKDKREVFERIAVLDFPVRLSEAAVVKRKIVKSRIADIKSYHDKSEGKIEQLKSSIPRLNQKLHSWYNASTQNKEALQSNCLNFDQDKQQKLATLQLSIESYNARIFPIEPIDEEIRHLQERAQTTELERCNTCDAPRGSQKKAEYLSMISKLKDERATISSKIAKRDELLRRLSEVTESINHYSAQLAEEEKRINPYIAELTQVTLSTTQEERSLASIGVELKDSQEELSVLNQLYDLSFDLRGELLHNAVKEIETQTNTYLEKYFDAELRIDLSINSSDLTVNIQKSGYNCVYRQLSKGQRQLLKLCFGVSTMKSAANRAGVHFDNLFLDEALDGLDAQFKIKAFDLFQELAKDHSSILIIDHSSEFQNLFDKKYHTELIGDDSEVYEES